MRTSRKILSCNSGRYSAISGGKYRNPDILVEVPKIVGPVPKMISEALSYLRTNVIKKRISKPDDKEKSDKAYNYPLSGF